MLSPSLSIHCNCGALGDGVGWACVPWHKAEGKRQLCGAGSLLSLLFGFSALNSGHQA